MKNKNINSVICPVCDSNQSVDFFSAYLPVDIGRLFSDRDTAKKAAFGNLNLCFCTFCGLVYNRSFESEHLKFEPGYEVSLTHSPIFQSFSNAVATRLIERYDIRNKTVVEVGCGKGEFLQLICQMGKNTGYGFDKTLPQPLKIGKVQLIPDYYCERYAQIEPDLLCSLSVFESIQYPVEFLSTIRDTIGDRNTKVYFEVFNGIRALKELSGWSVHYEQCNYWSLESLTAVFEKSGFAILDSGECYGAGEYLYVEAECAEFQRSVLNDLKWEMPKELANFSKNHDRTLTRWKTILRELQEAKKCVVVWGTGGKGIGFLNSVSTEAVSYVVDINPNRQGKFVPGSAHRIEAPDHLLKNPPDVIVITNPLYKDEIKTQVEGFGIHCDYMLA